jgi:hypothetical protein
MPSCRSTSSRTSASTTTDTALSPGWCGAVGSADREWHKHLRRRPCQLMRLSTLVRMLLAHSGHRLLQRICLLVTQSGHSTTDTRIRLPITMVRLRKTCG